MSKDALRRHLTQCILRLIAWFPLPLSRLLGFLMGRANYYLKTRAAKVTLENLELCLPAISAAERTKLCKKSLVHTGQTLFETPAIWLGSLNRVSSWITKVENEHLLDAAVEANKGVIVLLPHLGNWELFNVYFATRGKMTALYQPPRQVFLQPLMEKIRSKFGNELVATNIKGIARLYRCLAEGGVVTVLPDQVPVTGQFSSFFGEMALTDILVSRLIKKTQAVTVCCTVRREGRGFTVCFSPAEAALYSSEMDSSLQGLNQSIENAIGNHLEQYQWEYKRFRERPAGMKKLYSYKPDRAEAFH